MVRFEHGALVKVVPYLVELLHKVVVAGANLPVLVHLGQGCRFQHLNYEHCVVCRHRAAALRYNVGVGDAVLVGRIDHCIYGIVHILLNGVVHAALAARRACTVVVHAQATANVGELHLEAHLVQLHIELRSLAQCGLYVAYLGYLAAYVEVNEAQAILYVIFFENFECFEQFARCEAELARIAAALFPFAATLRGKFYSYAYIGAHTESFANLGNAFEFVQLFGNKVYAAAHLLRQQCHLNVAVVLVSVAYDERVAVGVHCNHLVQFGF